MISFRKPGYFSLRSRLALFFALISAIILAVGSFFSYRYIMGVFQQNNEKYLIQQMSQTDYNIQSLSTEVDRLSKLFIDDDSVQKFLHDTYGRTKLDYNTVENNNAIISRIGDFIFTYSYISSIYLITENNDTIGASAQNTYVNFGSLNSNSKFLGSPLHRSVQASFPKISAGGGIRESFYNPNLNTNTQTDNNDFIVSFARGIKPLNKPNRSASLIINVKEPYIESIYGKASTDEYRCIVDGSGCVISSSNSSDIGKAGAVSGSAVLQGISGSLTERRNNMDMQLVYYRLSGTDWYLIDEIPLKELSRDTAAVQRIIVAVFCSSVLLTILLCILFLKRITKPLETLSQKMDDVSSGKFGTTVSAIPNNEFGVLVRRFNEMSLSIAGLMKRNEEIQDEKIRMEIEALQAQINPHFIYNTLNMIKWMASMAHAGSIVESIIVLGNLLRPTFQDKNRMWTLRDETEYLQNYLKIMNWRYGNAIECAFAIGQEMDGCAIPKFILQPIVENCLTHGLGKRGRINVFISTLRQGEDLVIEVRDNGEGMDGALLEELNRALLAGEAPAPVSSSRSVGLRNINRRIRLNFGDRYGLRLESAQESGITAFVLLPAQCCDPHVPAQPDGSAHADI